MPYIKQEERVCLESDLLDVAKDMSYRCTPGTLNFIITKICGFYLRIKGENYTHYNDIIGVLESAKLEFYRRRVVPYEDGKIKENGDV